MNKRRLQHSIASASVVIILAAGSGLGKDISTNAGTSAFPFLKINVGARPVAMGGAFTGVADDESSLYYNPAGIAVFEEKRFIAGYHNYFVDMQSGFLGYVHSLNERQTLAFYVSYLNLGDFIETDMRGDVLGNFGGGDLLLAASFAMRQTYQFSAGVSAKLIYEKIHDFSAAGLAVDLGAKYTSDRGRYTVGLMVQNLGAQLSSLGPGERSSLPTIVRGGVSARPKGLPMLFATDVILPFDNGVDIACGAEYRELEPLYLRLGWNSFGSNYRVTESDDSWAGISLGMGVDYHSMQLSYAFSPAAELGESHRITLTGGF